tara:strand:+ start:4425 stop:7454 length:3030 start_codon:yes stop_codon:yes gene_type:complete
MYKFLFIVYFILFPLLAQSSLLDPSILRALNQAGVKPSEVEKLYKKEMESQENINDIIVPKSTSEKINKELDDLYTENISVNDSLIIKENPDSLFVNDNSLISREVVDKIRENTSDKILSSFEEENITNQYFGYDVFNSDPGIFEKSVSEAANPDYQLGPGDDIILMLWGETEFNREFTISKDGYLFIDNIGRVFVNGLTLDKLEKKLFRLLKKVYSSLGSDNSAASTYLDVSLGSTSLRPIRVFVLGDVDQPGAYLLKPSTTLFSSLYYFGGPNKNGSLRDIQLIRKDDKISSIDFYDYLMTGKQFNDSKLQKNDVIFIPQRKKTVRIYGEIKRQKYFEVDKNESLLDLIEFAGGLTTEAYFSRAQIKRIIPPKDRTDNNISRSVIDVDLHDIVDSKKKFVLADGDEIEIFKVNDKVRDFITIEGSIERPGVYNLTSGLTVGDLIKKADGLSENSFTERADIIRIDSNKTKTLISINIEKALGGDLKNNILLKSEDYITIYSLDDMLFLEDVNILGHVKNPGSKPFLKQMTVYDLVFLGGGFNDKEHLKNTYLERAELVRRPINGSDPIFKVFNLGEVLQKKGLYDLQLEMGDMIKIYSKSDVTGEGESYVEISGTVKNPGFYTYYKDFMLRDLLFMAGGFDDIEFLSNIYMDRADLIRHDEDLKSKYIVNFNLKDLLENKIADIELKPDDIVKIYDRTSFGTKKIFTVNGDVNSPGIYELKRNMKIKDVLLEAGGINPLVKKFRVDVARYLSMNASDGHYAELYSFNFYNNKNIYKIINDDKPDKKNNDLNFLIRPFDIITIRPEPFFSTPQTVNIGGYVFFPGEYPISSPNEKITDIIKRAGGLREEAYPLASSLKRNEKEINLSFSKIIKNPKSKLNFRVMPGDSIFIGSYPNVITILGAVNSPGNYQYLRGYSLKDYIRSAGGWANNASKSNVFISYPNGLSKKYNYNSIFPIKVEDGSIITIGEIDESEKFKLTEYLTNVTTVWSDLLQSYLLIKVLANETSN